MVQHKWKYYFSTQFLKEYHFTAQWQKNDLVTSKKGTENKSIITWGRNLQYTLLLTSACSHNHPNSEGIQKKQKDSGNGTKN